MDKASDWLNYLTAPSASPVADLPSPERLVMVAVLDDGSTANLGAAQHYPASGVYRMSEGGLEVSESARDGDGTFVTDSGRYRVLTHQEHTALKRDEAARAAREAAKAIAPPPAATTTVLRASTSLSALTIKPASVGCAAHAQMATVIAIGPSHIQLALTRIKPLIEIARSNHNYVTVVVLGVQNELEAEAALTTPTPRLLLAGANELEALRSRKATGTVRAYLREAVLVGLVPGSGKGYDDDGLNGVWCLPSASVSLDGSLGAIEPRGDKTMAKWQLAINTQWRDWYMRYDRQSTTLDDQDNVLMRAYTSFPKAPRHPPVSQLPRWSTVLLATGSGPAFGTVDHTILWRDGRSPSELWPCPCERWATTGSHAGSPYWAVASWCTNTQGALRTPAPLPDVQLTLDDLQYDVWTTLATLAVIKHGGVEGSPSRRLQQLSGVLGPVVLAGRANNEPMRVSWWTPSEGTPVLMLLPEAYVQIALIDYDSKRTTGQGQALLCSQGFLVLANADEVPIEFAGVTASELDGERAAFGPRLWSMRGTPPDPALPELHEAPAPRGGLVSYRTQTDADADCTRGLLDPGVRVGTSPTHSVFYTKTTSDDQLSGLRVRWTVADRPTLDVDTFEGGQQLAYERVR